MSAARAARRAAERQARRKRTSTGARMPAMFAPLLALPGHVRRAVAPVFRSFAGRLVADFIGLELLVIDIDGAHNLSVGPVPRAGALDVLRRSGLGDLAERLTPIAGDRFRCTYIDAAGEAFIIGARLVDSAAIFTEAG